MDDKIAVIVHAPSGEIPSTLRNSFIDAVPEGYLLDFICAKEYLKCQAYNTAMNESDAKYKIYMDSNVELVDSSSIQKLIDIFSSNPNIGAIGCSGAEILSTHGVCYSSAKRCGKFYVGAARQLLNWNNVVAGDYIYAEVLDGFFMATQYDVPWREDLFRGDTFSVASQCVEFKRKDYRVVVANQDTPWIWLKNEQVSIDNDDNRAFLDEYSADLFPIVSIMIPTYNRPQYLPIALDSVLNQTYRNIEIFVSDDSTNSETEQLMNARYIGKYKNLKYYRNVGFNGITNRAFLVELAQKSNGEYINWLHDDDFFYPRKIELMVEVLRNNPDVSCVTSPRNFIDENGNVTGTSNPFQNVNEFGVKVSGDEAGRLLFFLDNYIGEPPAVLIRKTEFNPIGDKFKRVATAPEGTHIIGCPDVQMWLHLLEHGNLYWINETLSVHRHHPAAGSASWLCVTGFVIDWALFIKYYWDKKVFLKTENDCRRAIIFWLDKHALRILNRAYQANYYDDQVALIEKLLVAMSQALSNGYQIDLPEISVEI